MSLYCLRRVFHWTTYVLFFYNVILGLTSALLRIVYSMTFGLVLMFRLDRVVLMRGFERFDAGIGMEWGCGSLESVTWVMPKFCN